MIKYLFVLRDLKMIKLKSQFSNIDHIDEFDIVWLKDGSCYLLKDVEKLIKHSKRKNIRNADNSIWLKENKSAYSNGYICIDVCTKLFV
jgi:hypothetical protein